MKIKIFGCSFMAGTDLLSNELVWPALIARDMGLEVENFAFPGIGNLRIMESVLNHADPDSFNIIGWSWIDRFDFLSCTTETWATLRPVLDHELAPFYFKHYHGQYRDMLTNLAYVTAAIDFLEHAKCQFLMTAIDRLMFESVRQDWHPPGAVHAMQTRVVPYITWFEKMTFLEWAKDQSFDISTSLHPLELAHRAAADLMRQDNKLASLCLTSDRG
jgi:hypothetical protein